MTTPELSLGEVERGFAPSVTNNIPKSVFDTTKNDYSTPTLLLGSTPGLFDSVNKKFPEIFNLYLKQKSIDWPHDEFGMANCNVEFKTASKAVADVMIYTLAWQWESDSMAARSVAPLIACFNPGSELWAAYSKIGENEVLHALAYSEIVRLSFDNPEEVLGEILERKEAFARMDAVSQVFGHAYKVGHEFALGLRQNDQETYNAAFMLIVAFLVMERIQFMSSFAVTFAVAESGQFIPIGKTVQKIAADELEIHVQTARAVLAHEITTERGKTARRQCDALIRQLIKDVLNSETTWSTFLLSEGRELPGVTLERLLKWVNLGGTDVCVFFGIDIEELGYEAVYKNPLKFLEKWVDISATQAAPQEQDNGQYKTNIISRDDDGVVFDVEF